MKRLFILALLLSPSAYALDHFQNSDEIQPINPYYRPQQRPSQPMTMFAGNGQPIPQTQEFYYNDPYTGQIRNNRGEVCQNNGVRMICFYQ